MTSKQETAKTAKPGPVELHDEALDKVDGGTTRTPYSGGLNVALGDGSVRSVTGGGNYTFAVSSGSLPSG